MDVDDDDDVKNKIRYNVANERRIIKWKYANFNLIM